MWKQEGEEERWEEEVMVKRKPSKPVEGIREELEEEGGKILDNRHRVIFGSRNELYGYRYRTYEDLGREFNITRSRVQQIESQAWRKVRRSLVVS